MIEYCKHHGPSCCTFLGDFPASKENRRIMRGLMYRIFYCLNPLDKLIEGPYIGFFFAEYPPWRFDLKTLGRLLESMPDPANQMFCNSIMDIIKYR